MRNYNRDQRSRRRNYSRPEMYNAVCDKCGRKCKVPFRPTGDKPVYCSDCFENQSGKRSRRNNFKRYDHQKERMYTAICDKCGNECEVPFKPTGSKPIFCNNCFKDTSRNIREKDRNQHDNDLLKKIDSINDKLEKILEVL